MQQRTSSNLKGFDVSHWQGTVDFAKAKANGYSFVYLKATQGSTYTDTMFSTNVSKAKAAGLPVGAYHYAKPTAPYNANEAVAQAKYFVNAMKNAGLTNYGDIMPVLDLEEPIDPGILTPNELAKWAWAFVSTVQSLTGRKVMFYTGTWFIEQNNGFDTALSDLPLWIADYRTTITSPPNCGGWTNWTIWQYSDKGTVPGVSSACDVDAGPTSLSYLK
jgi:GH25 family lysozyme M1 (1,4-beta-N-acetylmuramidase)